MARTLNDAWLREFRSAHVRPVVLMTIEVGGRSHAPDSPPSFSWVSGDAPLFGYPCSISSLSTMSVEVDVISRNSTIGEISVTLVDDGTLRAVLSAYTLKNRRVTIKIGTPNLSETEFEVFATQLRIEEILPERGSITVSAIQSYLQFLDVEDSAREYPNHPARVIQTILKRNPLAARHLAPDENFSIADSDTSHHVITRHQFFPVPEDDIKAQGDTSEPLIDRINEICELSYGLFRTDALGQAEYVPWNPLPQGGPVAHLGPDDIQDVSQISAFDNLITRVRASSTLQVSTRRGRNGTGFQFDPVDADIKYSAQDSVAEQELRGDLWGEDGAVSEHEAKSSFFASGASVGRLFPYILPIPGLSSGYVLSDSDTSLVVPLPLWHGFCGTLTTDAGARTDVSTELANSATYGTPMSAQMSFPPLGSNVIQLDGFFEPTQLWNDAAIAGTYNGPLDYFGALQVIWWDGPPIGGVELGRAVVTDTFQNWLRFEAISPTLRNTLAQKAITAPGVYYTIVEYGASVTPLSRTIDPAQEINANRPAYILLFDQEYGRNEIVKATAFAYDFTKSATSKTAARLIEQAQQTSRAYWNEGTFTIERGQLGTTPQTFYRYTMAFDITVAVYLAKTLLERAHFGIPKVQLRVGLHFMGLEVGDIVQLTDPMIIAHRLSGSTVGTVTWEIVSIEVDITSESPGISLVLAAASISTHTPAAVIDYFPPGVVVGRSRNETYFDQTAIPYIDGLAVEYVTRW